MKNLELKELGVEPLSNSEMQTIEGGLLLGLWGLVVEGIKFLVGEVTDFIDGVGDGFNAVTGYNK